MIEVAITSAEIDEGKAEIYAEGKILEYWIVEPEKRLVTVFRDPSPAGYASKTVHTATDILHPRPFPDLAIPVAALLPPVEK